MDASSLNATLKGTHKIALLLAVFAIFAACLLVVAPQSAFAQASGTGWTLDDEGTLTLTADIADTANEHSDYGWASYASQIKTVKVAEGVTRVPKYAFYSDLNNKVSYSSLTSFTSASTVKTIGERAFYGDSSLASIDLNEGVSVESCAFMRTGITKLTVPANSTVGYNAFGNCDSLKSITIKSGANISELSSAPFGECDNLETVVYEEGVTCIGGDKAFINCPNLKTIRIAESVTEGFYDDEYSQWLTPIQNGIIIGYKGSMAEKYVEHWAGISAASSWFSATFHAIDGDDHTGEWVTVKEATATEDGESQLVCTICGTTVTKTIPATGGSATEETETSSTTESSQDDSADEDSDAKSLAKTGDNAGVGAAALLACAASAACIGIALRRKSQEL